MNLCTHYVLCTLRFKFGFWVMLPKGSIMYIVKSGHKSSQKHFQKSLNWKQIQAD